MTLPAEKSLLNRRWGESPAADRVWAQVTGMRPSEAVRQRIMVFQIFLDESISGKTFVMAGCVAKAEAWAAFSRDWEEMLPFAALQENGSRNFKFSEMYNAGQLRRENIMAFARIIDRHSIFTFSLCFDVTDLTNAIGRIQIPDMTFSLDHYRNPYIYAFNRVLSYLQSPYDPIVANILGNEKVDLIFDDRSEKSQIRKAWENIDKIPKDPTIVLRFDTAPRFELDNRFLPLQGADLIAGWARYWMMRGGIPNGGQWGFTGVPDAPRDPSDFTLHRSIMDDEDAIASHLAGSLRLAVPATRYVLDVKVSFSGSALRGL